MNYPHPIIAREGWPFLAISIILAIAVTVWCAVWSIPLWVIALFVLQFFRDPPREIPQNAGVVLSPADGRIVAVERINDPYLKRESIKISVTEIRRSCRRRWRGSVNLASARTSSSAASDKGSGAAIERASNSGITFPGSRALIVEDSPMLVANTNRCH